MNMRRPIYTALILAVAASTSLTTSLQGAQGASKRPNVIVVMTDDQGYGDVGFHGNEVVRTPNLDNFAKESIELTQFYVTPVCSTTRAGLLTGRYQHRAGIPEVLFADPRRPQHYHGLQAVEWTRGTSPRVTFVVSRFGRCQ